MFSEHIALTKQCTHEHIALTGTLHSRALCTHEHNALTSTLQSRKHCSPKHIVLKSTLHSRANCAPRHIALPIILHSPEFCTPKHIALPIILHSPEFCTPQNFALPIILHSRAHCTPTNKFASVITALSHTNCTLKKYFYMRYAPDFWSAATERLFCNMRYWNASESGNPIVGALVLAALLKLIWSAKFSGAL